MGRLFPIFFPGEIKTPDTRTRPSSNFRRVQHMHRSLIKTRFPLDLYLSMKGESAFHPFRSFRAPFRSPAGIQRGWGHACCPPTFTRSRWHLWGSCASTGAAFSAICQTRFTANKSRVPRYPRAWHNR